MKLTGYLDIDELTSISDEELIRLYRQAQTNAAKHGAALEEMLVEIYLRSHAASKAAVAEMWIATQFMRGLLDVLHEKNKNE